jgi:hypothetical protein
MVRPRLLGSFQLLQQLFFFFSQYHFVPRFEKDADSPQPPRRPAQKHVRKIR